MPEPGDIDARLARYAVSLDASDLWPEIPVPAFRAAQRELARATGAVLADGAAPARLVVPDGVTAHTFGVAASAAGVGPLLGYWLQAGRLTASPAVADLLATHLEHGRRRAAALRGALDGLLVPLAARGVEVVVLKGTDTGYHLFPEPGTRPAADVDLLVRAAHLDAAQAVLRAQGFVAADRAPPSRTPWTPPGSQAVRSLDLPHAGNPWSVDLHTSLDRDDVTPGAVLRGEDPFAGPEVRTFARPVRVLPQPLALAYLALHASTHFFELSLLRLIELVLVARGAFAGFPERWGALDALLARTGTERFAFPSLSLAERLSPGTVDPALLGRLRRATPPRLQRRVDRLTPGTAQQLHPRPPGRSAVFAASWGVLVAGFVAVLWPRDSAGPRPLKEGLVIQWRRVRRAVLHVTRAERRQ